MPREASRVGRRKENEAWAVPKGETMWGKKS